MQRELRISCIVISLMLLLSSGICQSIDQTQVCKQMALQFYNQIQSGRKLGVMNSQNTLINNSSQGDRIYPANKYALIIRCDNRGECTDKSIFKSALVSLASSKCKNIMNQYISGSDSLCR